MRLRVSLGLLAQSLSYFRQRKGMMVGVWIGGISVHSGKMSVQASGLFVDKAARTRVSDGQADGISEKCHTCLLIKLYLNRPIWKNERGEVRRLFPLDLPRFRLLLASEEGEGGRARPYLGKAGWVFVARARSVLE